MLAAVLQLHACCNMPPLPQDKTKTKTGKNKQNFQAGQAGILSYPGHFWFYFICINWSFMAAPCCCAGAGAFYLVMLCLLLCHALCIACCACGLSLRDLSLFSVHETGLGWAGQCSGGFPATTTHRNIIKHAFACPCACMNTMRGGTDPGSGQISLFLPMHTWRKGCLLSLGGRVATASRQQRWRRDTSSCLVAMSGRQAPSPPDI